MVHEVSQKREGKRQAAEIQAEEEEKQNKAKQKEIQKNYTVYP